MLKLEEPLPSAGIEVSVPEGAPAVVAAFLDENDGVPSGVTISVTLPDGTVLDTPTQPNDPNMMVRIENGSLSALAMVRPLAGVWRIAAASTNEHDEYYFSFSTIPTQDVLRTVETTLERMADADALDELGDDAACFWCKFGFGALAVVIMALVAVGAAFVTSGAAPVVALAAALGCSTTAAMSLILGLITLGVGSVALVLSYVCWWMSACPAP